MPRTAIWRSIAETLTREIAEGHYAPGEKLPTEAQLSARFGVNRHTVRHALKALVERGLVRTRRGAGAFVAQKPADYPIGRRVRFNQNFRDAGRTPAREVISAETRRANRREVETLELENDAFVHVREGLSLADGQPIALSRSIFPAAPFPDLHAQLDALGSVTEMLAANGVDDYLRLSTRLTAVAATATQALHLRLHEGDPILRSVAVEADPAGRPVQFGTTWFAGDRVTLTLGDL